MSADFPPLAGPQRAPRARATLLAASSPHVLEIDQSLAIVAELAGLSPTEALNRSLCGLPIGTAQAQPLKTTDQAANLRERHGYLLRKG